MKKHFLIYPAILFLFWGIALPIELRANGAAWNPGLPSGTPHPVQQSGLYLDKEHVSIKDGKVTAIFFVHNPTKHDLKITMGFPIDYQEKNKRRLPREGITQDFLSNYEFHVTSHNKQLETDLIADINNDYPIVYTWEMIFPASSSTEFTASYKYIPAEGTDSATFGGPTITYITHTGSFWSKPIGAATFEYCNPEFVDKLEKSVNEAISGWTKNGDVHFTLKFLVHPKPYSIDKQNKCVVWKRQNWKPQIVVDDLSIGFSWKKEIYIGEDGYIWDGREGFFDNLCGITSQRSEHFGETLKLSAKIINEVELQKLLMDEIQRQSHTWDGQVDANQYPTHIKTDLLLLLLRYLRNYLFAISGHEFNDDALAKCFANISTKKSLSTIEKENLNVITNLELKIKKINSDAWQAVRENIKKEDTFIPSKL